MELVKQLNALGKAIAELARYGNHDSHCEWTYSMTNPRKPCSCGFDEAICAVSNLQDNLMKIGVALNTCKHERFITINLTGNLAECDECTQIFSLESEQATIGGGR